MQQTQTYKLNLIDKNDIFSSDPLNDNARKLEAALADETSARQTADTTETNARKAADTTETNARKAADTAETNARKSADAAEEAARKAADAEEAKARQAADTAETNARKAADTAEANARQAAVTALDQRLKVFEAKKIAKGTYTGAQGPDRTISVGFTPKLVFFSNRSGGCTLLTEDAPLHVAVTSGSGMTAKIVTGGFQLLNITNSVNPLDLLNQPYHYLAYA